jgi:two-component system, sensor histidine kinase and response regulator
MTADAVPRVLVVDDEPANLLALRGVLESLDLEVVAAGSGAQALRVLLEGEVAVILLDVMMPDMDGFETAAHIKARDRLAGTPIIFLTALGHDHLHRSRGYASGAVDYLAKPVDPEVLRAKVSVFIELHRQRALLEERTAQLERLNAELEQFASVVSHDLREPLRVMEGFLGLLAEAAGLEEEERGFVARAEGAARRMDQLITDLLAFARLDAEAGAAVPVPLAAVVEAALLDLDLALREAGARVEVGPLPVVMGAPSLLTRLVVNLIGNALKFRSEQAPVITVRAEQAGQTWQVTVADNGIGIPPEHRERIFVMGRRLHSQDAYPGSGIGLALCRKIVERHGGRIWADAGPVGGTALHFTLAGEGGVPGG